MAGSIAGSVVSESINWAYDQVKPDWVKEHAPIYWVEGGDAIYLYIYVPDDQMIYVTPFRIVPY